MYIDLLEKYKLEIEKHFKQANIISLIPEIGNEAYIGAILKMCIKYEALTSDIMETLYKIKPRYNHPWSNTREIAKKLKINIDIEYKHAHDAWDLYNTLKHINDKTEIDQHKLFKKYNLLNMKDAAIFVKNSLIKLIYKIKNK